ncbi:MAG: CPBP family intramembrane metalloprotease [Chlamydiales bacterium]|nr:CPBP family intramembrane metalloprotease [Chlamydiales bacterium]
MSHILELFYLIPEKIVTLLYLAALALIALAIAWRAGFFHLKHPYEMQRTGPNLFQLMGAFFVYLGIQVILLPSLAITWIVATDGEASIEDAFSKPMVEGWINFVGVALALPLLVGYSMLTKVAIWEKQGSSPMQRFRDISLGVITWFIAFPIVTLAAETIHDLSRMMIEAPPLDQVAVRHLKSTYGDYFLTGASTIAIVAFVPVIEELLFRGFVQSYLRQNHSAYVSILVTAGLFTLVHFSPSQGVANAELLTGLFFLSLFLGFLYERQGSLWACIGLHCIFNAISVTMILLGYGEG